MTRSRATRLLRGRMRLGLVVSCLLGGAGAAHADSDARARNAQTELSNVDRESGAVQSAIESAKGRRLTVEQRLANGELLYRSKDYSRAVMVFSEILEEYPDTRAYSDALWLRGETYYASKEYLSARRDYRALVQRGQESRFQSFYPRALARLIDVSLRTGDLRGLDEVFAQMNQLSSAGFDAGLQYAKGKAYFIKKDYATAQQAFAAVANNSPYVHMARYFQGVVAMKLTPGTRAEGARTIPANYKQAIEAFRVVTQLPPDTLEHRHVIDLAWMAIGRLFYEMEQYTQAAAAYNKVDRDSPEFGAMLYELAWTYVRIGDAHRAERALEVLSVADPTSPLVSEGALLRADLLLRTGVFSKALKLYEGVRAEFDPVRAKVEAFIDTNSDPGVFYDRLMAEFDAVEHASELPPIAVRWAREAEDGPLAFAVIDDITHCRTLIKQSYLLVDRLMALIDAANRVRAFPELAAGEERAIGLINRIARARLELARGLDEEEPKNVDGEVGTVREQRRALMGAMEQVPITSAEFNEREVAGMRQWNTVSQSLSARNLEIDQLQALVNGLRRMLREDAQRGVTRDTSSVSRFQAEIDANERDLKVFREQAAELRKQVEFGRFQIGIGDARYQADAVARGQFRDVLDREVDLVKGGRAGGEAQRYAQRIQPLLAEARAVEDKLAAAFFQLEKQVEQKVGDVRNKIETERAKINQYSAELDTYDKEGRDLVGQVAKRNFELVRDKLRNIVLRADVGITEQAWEVREEQLDRVRILQTERARQEHLLDEELREVLDDAGDKSGPAAK